MSTSRFVASLFPILCGFGYAWADTDYGFALTLQRDITDLRIDNVAAETVRERVGITIWEPGAPNLRLGLTLGQLFVTQSRYPTAAGLDFSGFYATLDARQTLVHSEALQTLIDVGYQYEQADSETNDAIRWHALAAGATARMRTTPWLQVLAGVRYGVLRGTERVANTPARHADVEEQRNYGMRLGLVLNVERGGDVALIGQTGLDRSAAIVFSRTY